MSENYIVINGKKMELTQEKLEQLGIKEKSPFDRVAKGERYYFINSEGELSEEKDTCTSYDDSDFNIANYCTAKALMEQRALHETLNRLLWWFSMENGGDEIDWTDTSCPKYCITKTTKFGIDVRATFYFKEEGIVYFNNRLSTGRAIKEIVEPFIAGHPEFEW